MTNVTEMDSQNPLFFVKSENTDFSKRSKAIFDQLPLNINEEVSLSKNHQKAIVKYSSRNESDNQVSTDMKQFKRQESIFKKPSFLPPRFRKTKLPGYAKNPEKWTKYSLEDVSQEDMSENTNMKTALSFLHELANQRKMEAAEDDEEEDDDTNNGTDKKIVYKKPKEFPTTPQFVSSESTEQISNHAHYESNTLIMPEYVVGRSKTVNKRERKPYDKKQIQSQKIKLDHLEN